MRKHSRTLLVTISALAALATVSACSGPTSTDATSTSPTSTPTTKTASAFPEAGRYVADMKAADGKTMTIGISVEGAQVAAYACNGTDDEAWFFGDQTAGAIDITGRFRDTLKADFNGTDVTGDLSMNGVGYQFTAAPVSGVAGMYTASVDGVRASWVVREDGSATGVQLNGSSGRDSEQAELQQLKDAQFRAEVRNKRILQQAQQITKAPNGTMSSSINGRQVTPTLVTGSFRLS